MQQKHGRIIRLGRAAQAVPVLYGLYVCALETLQWDFQKLGGDLCFPGGADERGRIPSPWGDGRLHKVEGAAVLRRGTPGSGSQPGDRVQAPGGQAGREPRGCPWGAVRWRRAGQRGGMPRGSPSPQRRTAGRGREHSEAGRDPRRGAERAAPAVAGGRQRRPARLPQRAPASAGAIGDSAHTGH